MWNRFIVWLTNYSLSRSTLTLEQRNKIIIHIISSLHALPISGIITVNEEEEVLLSGRPLDFDKLRHLRESSIAALDNQAFKIINQEVLYAAVVGGLHKATTPEDLYFYRAAIWFGQQVQAQLRILAQRTD